MMATTDPTEIFTKRQDELRRQIAEGDAAIADRYRTLGRDEYEIRINVTESNPKPTIVVKPEVQEQLDAELKDWRRKRRDLTVRIMD